MKRELEQAKKQRDLKIYFEVKSKLDIAISTTKNYWDIITRIKHPTLYKKEKEVKETLINPDEIRVSKRAKDIFLFYKKLGRSFLCVVVRIFKKRGFIVTAYWTNKIKEGEIRWKK